jgi:hypothetical protein
MALQEAASRAMAAEMRRTLSTGDLVMVVGVVQYAKEIAKMHVERQRDKARIFCVFRLLSWRHFEETPDDRPSRCRCSRCN